MITTILSDLSGVLLQVRNKDYKGTLNGLHYELSQKYFQYNFFDYFEFNEELLNFFQRMKGRYVLGIYTTGVIQNLVEVRKILDPVFSHIFSTLDFNTNKTRSSAYGFVTERMDVSSDKILFIDDKSENIEAAVKAGLNAIKYTDNNTLFSELSQKYNIA